MITFMYQATLLCKGCALKVRKDLAPEREGRPSSGVFYDAEDSDDFPVGPYYGEGEADYPQHCDHCQVFLENPLTDDGVNHLLGVLRDRALDGRGNGAVLREWMGFYQDHLGELDGDTAFTAFMELLDLRESPAAIHPSERGANSTDGPSIFDRWASRPSCVLDHDLPGRGKIPAEFLAPQAREDRVDWLPICQTHAQGWFDNSGYAGGMFRLFEVS